MAYTLTLTNGTNLIPGGLTDGGVNQDATSLTLIGKNFAGYGTYLNENFIYLLENFSNQTSPPHPLTGQLWWDSKNNILKVYSGKSWKISTGATSSGDPPGDLSTLGGDLWFDNQKSQLKVYDGSSWITVGPVQTPETGNSGVFPILLADAIPNAPPHVVLQFVISGTIFAIFSKEAFTSALNGFATVVPGLNFSTIAPATLGLNTQDTTRVPGTLVQRDTMGGIDATSVVTSTLIVSGSMNGTITTPAQTNITSLGTLTSLAVSGNINAQSNVNVTNQLTAANLVVGSLVVSDQIINSGNLAIANITSASGLSITSNIQATSKTTGALKVTGGASINTGNLHIGGSGGNAVIATGDIRPSNNAASSLGGTNTYWNNVLAVSGQFNSLTVQAQGITAVGDISTSANLQTTGSGIINSVGGIISAGVVNINNTTQAIDTTSGALKVLGGAGISGNLYIGGSNGNAIVATGNINVAGSILPFTSNASYNIGSTTSWFNNIYGTAIHAQYADLAERFEADEPMIPGTVVEIGGPAEITRVTKDLSDRVFGVISTKAAYLMNSRAGTDQTHPPVAVQGRVPVRVIGKIRKGDRLVSAGNGLARAGKPEEITAWNVIGRALENKMDSGEGTVEAVVKLNS